MDKQKEYIFNNLNIQLGDYLVVAVSGGPDSMALLHFINSLKDDLGVNIVCSHVNHNIREESKEERKFVEQFCLENFIVFESMTIAEYGEDNFHNEARKKRYNFFDNVVNKYDAKYLFTAHHADDLMETILMRISRGATLKGYAGFGKNVRFNNYTVIRPFFEITKKEVFKYINEHKLEYKQDASNNKDIYTRNRYRKYMIPFLKNEDANIHLKFIKFSNILADYSDYFDRLVEEIIETSFKDNVLDLKKYSKIDFLLQRKVLFYILEHIYQDDLILINDNHVELLENLISSDKPNTFINLPNDLKVTKEYNKLYFSDCYMEDDYEVMLSESVKLPNQMMIEILKHDFPINGNDLCRLSAEDVVFPLNVRPRR
ncbi:MAG: tRNA lysidine(34) synthetase TilS, partial [Bacilli bacterium]